MKKYKGPAVDMRWGPVQVTIAVKGKKITNISAMAPMERSRSAFINGQAIPLLKHCTGNGVAGGACCAMGDSDDVCGQIFRAAGTKARIVLFAGGPAD